MPAGALFLVVLLAVAAALRGSPRVVASVLVGTWLLVPGAARVPGTGDGQLLIHRVVIAAVLAGLAWRALAGRLNCRAFQVRGVHLAFGAFLAVAAVVGIVLAEGRTEANQNLDGWLALGEQAAFFVAALAVFRELGARRSVEVISAVAGVLAVIAISEQLLGWSYARWFASGIPDPTGLMTLPLEQRGPHVRVRASATFALELGWVLAMLVPATIASALVRARHTIDARMRARVATAIPALLVLALVATWSRSSYAGVTIGVMALLLGAVLDRPRQIAVVALGCVLLAALTLQAPLQEAIDLTSVAGEQDVRLQRLPEVLEPVASRPLIGLGLGGLLSRGIHVVDNSWVTTYATLGVVGLLALGALLVTLIHSTGRFLRAGPGDARLIGAAAAGAVAASLVALASYDFGTLRASTEALWAVGALGLVANEEMGVLRRPLRLRRPPVRIWFLAMVGSAVGSAALFVTPARSSTDAVFTTVDPLYAAAAPSDQAFTVKVLAQTACLVIEGVGPAGAVECRDQDQLAGGIGEVRIEAASAAEVDRWYLAVEERLLDTFPAATLQVEAQGRGWPAGLVTAPLWAAGVGAALGALIPATTAGAAAGARHEQPGTALGPARRRSRMPTRTG